MNKTKTESCIRMGRHAAKSFKRLILWFNSVSLIIKWGYQKIQKTVECLNGKMKEVNITVTGNSRVGETTIAKL